MKPSEQSFQLAKRHIVEQERRIARQRVLIEELEDHGHPEQRVAEARQLLAQMLDLLKQMRSDRDDAEQRVRTDAKRQALSEEESLDRVMRNCPL